MNQNQAHLFYIFLLTGVLIGILFDLFRILRRCFKCSNFITIIQDMLFFILMSILVLFVLFKFNNGIVRSYVLVGILVGLLAYFFIFSKIFIKINIEIIEFTKNMFMIFVNIFIYPFKLLNNLLKKTLFKPISFIFINIKKGFKNIFFNVKTKRSKFKKKVKKSTN